MENSIKYSILDKQRKRILDQLSHFKKKFYLAGGTALALQIGHRHSIDFDYFTHVPFDNKSLFDEIQQLFGTYKIIQIQNTHNTLSVLLNQKIKFSFFTISDTNVLPLIDTQYFFLLPAQEIAVMKIAALLRAAYRDYVDLYYLFHDYSLQDIFTLAKKKYKNFDEGVYLKCLLSYDDITMSPIRFIKGFEVTPKQVFSFIKKTTEIYLKSS